MLKNDPAFVFFAPIVFPLAMGILAKILSIELRALDSKIQIGATCLFVVFTAIALLVAYSDIKVSPVEPYMLRVNDALAYETDLRRQIHTFYREINTGDLPNDQVTVETSKLHALQRRAAVESRELAKGFQSWRDLCDRGATVARVQLFVNCVIAVGCAAFMSWLFLAGYNVLFMKTVPKTVDATIICFGLLLLWFPLRLYSEWYIGFYTLRSLRDFWTFWFLGVAAVIGLFLAIVILKPGTPAAVLGGFWTALLAAFGILAKLKPAVLGYAAVVFEEMPVVPYVLALLLCFSLITLGIVTATIVNAGG